MYNACVNMKVLGSSLLLMGMVAGASALSTPALINSVSTVGNQSWTGPLGLDFDVTGPSNILITHLGAFDSGQDGLNSAIRVGIFDRISGLLLGDTTLVGAVDPLDGVWRMQALATPFVLQAGGQYSVVALGYGSLEQNYNTQGSGFAATPNGGGYLSFVGSSRYDGPSSFVLPTTLDGSAIRYGAGTFAFAPVPEPFTMTLGAAGIGLAIYRRRRRTA